MRTDVVVILIGLALGAVGAFKSWDDNVVLSDNLVMAAGSVLGCGIIGAFIARLVVNRHYRRD